MFDIDDLMNGYTKQDEFIARDLLLINLLIDKGVITREEVKERFKKLPDLIKEVKEAREEQIKKNADDASKRLKEFYNRGDNDV